MSNETTTVQEEQSILTKHYKWSNYAFIVSIASLTLFNGLVILLMIMHRSIDSEINYKNWVIILVGILLELVFGFFAFLDSRRKNPKETLFSSRMMNMPIFVLTIVITIASFWGRTDTLAIVYGGICGGFAGYLAGALAYGNFFIKVKDIVFRTVFGGWVGVLIGTITGSVLAYLVDPFGGGVFGGIFMGFWGGAIISGPIAVVLLHFLRKNEKFTLFFTKLHLYGTISEVSEDLKAYFEKTCKDSLKIEDCKVFEINEIKEAKFKDKDDVNIWKKFLRGFTYIAFLTSPWEYSLEEYRIETFNQIFTLAAEKQGYTLDDGIITK